MTKNTKRLQKKLGDSLASMSDEMLQLLLDVINAIRVYNGSQLRSSARGTTTTPSKKSATSTSTTTKKI